MSPRRAAPRASRLRRLAAALLIAGLTAGLGLAVEGWARLGDEPPLTLTEIFWLSLYEPAPAFVPVGRGRWGVSEAIEAMGNAQRSVASRSPRGTYRVLCVGGSSAAGWPYNLKGGFPEWLRAMLADALGRPVEVLNAGIHGYGITEDARIARDLSVLPWDLVVAYEGHNLEYTADACRPASTAWRLKLELWLLRHSFAYRLLRERAGPGRSELRHARWIRHRDSAGYRSCLADGVDAGIAELARLSRRHGWPLLVVGAIHGPDLWGGDEIFARLGEAARREGVLYLDAGASAAATLADAGDLTIGDGIHPVLAAQWAVARGILGVLAVRGLPRPGALSAARLEGYEAYRARLGLGAGDLADAHARLGLMFVAENRRRARREFESAERLKPGVLSRAVGSWSSAEELDAVLGFYNEHGQRGFAEVVAPLRRRPG